MLRRSRSVQRANLRWPFVGKRERERKVSGRAFSSFGGPPCKPLTSFFRHFHPGEFGARLIRTGCGSEEPVSAPRPREWLHGAPPGTPLVTDSPGVDLSAGAKGTDGGAKGAATVAPYGRSTLGGSGPSLRGGAAWAGPPKEPVSAPRSQGVVARRTSRHAFGDLQPRRGGCRRYGTRRSILCKGWRGLPRSVSK